MGASHIEPTIPGYMYRLNTCCGVGRVRVSIKVHGRFGDWRLRAARAFTEKHEKKMLTTLFLNMVMNFCQVNSPHFANVNARKYGRGLIVHAHTDKYALYSMIRGPPHPPSKAVYTRIGTKGNDVV